MHRNAAPYNKRRSSRSQEIKHAEQGGPPNAHPRHAGMLAASRRHPSRHGRAWVTFDVSNEICATVTKTFARQGGEQTKTEKTNKNRLSA